MDDCGLVPLIGLPVKIDIEGYGQITAGPNKLARDLAASYMRAAGFLYNPVKKYVRVDARRAKRIAREYDKMSHAPDDPGVRYAYSGMISETLAQYQFVKSTNLRLELIRDANPYLVSPRLALVDIAENNHLWVLPSEQEFGPAGTTHNGNVNLLLDWMTDEYIDGVQLCANDVFRITHDFFGHFKEGVGFLEDGEENAWRGHASMYSRDALGAITTELRGQNSWVNFNEKHGDTSRKAQRVGKARLNDVGSATFAIEYAPQKNGLLPEWVWDEGRED